MTSTSDSPPPYYDVFNLSAKLRLDAINSRRYPRLADDPKFPNEFLDVNKLSSVPVSRLQLDSSNMSVGIIGAGASGLYAALIFESLGIKYEILEASDRIGGRLYTYKFPQGEKYDYFDVGAMRFPDSNIMNRLFHLFRYPELNKGNLQLAEKLIPYHYRDADKNNIKHFNERNAREYAIESNREVNYYNASELFIPPIYTTIGYDKIVEDVLLPFVGKLEEDFDNLAKHTDPNTPPPPHPGWDFLMKYDGYSLRAYMHSYYRPSSELRKMGMPDSGIPSRVIDWLENMEGSTGSYDKGFSDGVLEAMAFGLRTAGKGLKEEELNWKCIDGGSQVLTQIMADYVEERNAGKQIIKRHQLVTAIKPVDSNKPNERSAMQVHTAGNENPHTYDLVISTLPLSCLRIVDLSGCKLQFPQTNAMRRLSYGPSVKVGILFKTAWWNKGAVDQHGQRVGVDVLGGQSSTDRPVRCVVYPSHGSGKSRVLIASYCWTADAERLGALIDTNKDKFGTGYDERLKSLVLGDLAVVHNLPIEFLQEQCEDIYAWSWDHNPLSAGAFAFFGPSQFNESYKSLAHRPAADGRLFFAGEALSTRHAWVEGALESAWRAVHGVLMTTKEPERTKLLERFYETWGRHDQISPSVTPRPQEASSTAQAIGVLIPPIAPIALPIAAGTVPIAPPIGLVAASIDVVAGVDSIVADTVHEYPPPVIDTDVGGVSYDVKNDILLQTLLFANADVFDLSKIPVVT